jgi:hypothetical protein
LAVGPGGFAESLEEDLVASFVESFGDDFARGANLAFRIAVFFESVCELSAFLLFVIAMSSHHSTTHATEFMSAEPRVCAVSQASTVADRQANGGPAILTASTG